MHRGLLHAHPVTGSFLHACYSLERSKIGGWHIVIVTDRATPTPVLRIELGVNEEVGSLRPDQLLRHQAPLRLTFTASLENSRGYACRGRELNSSWREKTARRTLLVRACVQSAPACIPPRAPIETMGGAFAGPI